MKVLVTGGTGFVGKRLQSIKPNWIYISSKDYDLVATDDCKRMYNDIQPDAVVHLAGKVGGIKANDMNPADFYYINTMINTNIVHQAKECGIKRVLSSLSTCTFPDVVPSYPLTEQDILCGPPAITNMSYGYAKRSLYIQSKAYRKQYNLDYSTFCPSNLYGPEDNFDYDSSHFVSALVRRFFEAKNGDTLEFWGSGNALRQQLFVDDLAHIIPMLLEEHHSDIPIIVAPNENLSISNMIDILRKYINKDVNIKFNSHLDGQYRKDGSNAKLVDMIGDFNFTPFEEGAKTTYNWYSAQNG